MAQPNRCDGCDRAGDCKEMYHRLGCSEGPSVTLPAIVAFLLPIAAFAVTLAGLGWLLENRVAGPYQTPVALVGALSVTTGLMLVVRAMIQPRRKK